MASVAQTYRNRGTQGTETTKKRKVRAQGCERTALAGAGATLSGGARSCAQGGLVRTPDLAATHYSQLRHV